MALSCRKKLSALFKVLSKHDEKLLCLNCFHSYSAENKLKEHKNVCDNHDCCYIEMPKKIIKYQNTTIEKNL